MRRQRFEFSPAVLKDLRDRLEHTGELQQAIAADYGIDRHTLRRIILRNGWGPYRRRIERNGADDAGAGIIDAEAFRAALARKLDGLGKKVR